VSGTAAVELRPPAPADVDAMLTVVAACDETWREWTPDGWEPPAAGSARWVRELGHPERWTRLAVEPEPGGRVVGLVSWGPARMGPEWRVVPGTAHLGALFVHPERWREGIAARLLEDSVAAMRAAGYRRARLSTPEGAPAERFYRAHGWSRTGAPRWHSVLALWSVDYAREL
jgi:GNAT superfamily N-acetyltransferase